MKLTFLGVCAGSEPLPGYHHTSFVIEHAAGVYWFDAGETCSYHGHLAGIDLLSVRGIFISHPHMDHVGGLPNLLWNMRKISGRTHDPARRLTGKTVRLMVPDIQLWNGVRTILAGTESGFRIDYTLDVNEYDDGVIHDDEHGFRVRAMHNRHLGEPADGERWRSYSFRVEAGGKSVVFSGDVRHISELRPLLDGCDLLLMETGHHKVDEVCQYLADEGSPMGQLGFLHHGRAIVADPPGELAKARAILDDKVFLAAEGQQLEL